MGDERETLVKGGASASAAELRLNERVLDAYLGHAMDALGSAARAARKLHREGTADVLDAYRLMVGSIRRGSVEALDAHHAAQAQAPKRTMRVRAAYVFTLAGCVLVDGFNNANGNFSHDLASADGFIVADVPLPGVPTVEGEVVDAK